MGKDKCKGYQRSLAPTLGRMVIDRCSMSRIEGMVNGGGGTG